MSNKNRASKFNDVLRSIDLAVQGAGNQISSQVAQGAYSQEHFGAFSQNFEHETAGLRNDLINAFDTLGDSEFSLEGNEASIQAGLIALAASTGDHRANYHRSALSNQAGEDAMSLESVYSGIGGDIDVGDSDYSQEAFDETQLSNFTAQNIFFNVMASRQDAFGEAFFPTKVMTPSEGGLKITVDRQEVIDYVTHPTSGRGIDVRRRNLIDAFTDHEILNRPATEIVPYVRADGTADASFVAESDVGTRAVRMGDVNVETRPLRFGRKINLLGVSQHPGLVDSGVNDNTDQIAAGMRLKRMYAKATSGETSEVIAFNVENHTRNQFKKSHEGQGREVQLNFISETIVLDKDVKTVANSDSQLFELIRNEDLIVNLAVSVSGQANLDLGNVELNSSEYRVEAVYNAAGEEIGLDSGVGKQVVDLVESLGLRNVGYDLGARRSNSNWRSTGALIDVTPYTESYAIEPGYPISVLTATDEQQHGQKISGMVNAARLRNSNNAVTMLLNYAESLEAYSAAFAKGIKADLIGAARHIVRPFFEAIDVEVDGQVVSEKTSERAKDVSATLINAIREVGYRMYRDTNYGPALDLANAGAETKPTLLIGCDPVTKRYLDITADDRLLGEHMNVVVVDSNDRRVNDKIFMTFTTGRPATEDGLGFGVHAYVPELIQRVTRTQNGSTRQQDRVVPRSIHVPVLPILAVLDVKGLKGAITNTVESND